MPLANKKFQPSREAKGNWNDFRLGRLIIRVATPPISTHPPASASPYAGAVSF
jgi:hypothetical protein